MSVTRLLNELANRGINSSTAYDNIASALKGDKVTTKQIYNSKTGEWEDVAREIVSDPEMKLRAGVAVGRMLGLEEFGTVRAIADQVKEEDKKDVEGAFRPQLDVSIIQNKGKGEDKAIPVSSRGHNDSTT